MNMKQYTFSEMSRKMVVNIADGRELGHVCDMVFNNCGGVLGFVVPGKKSLFKSLTSSENIFISWNRIIKIGSDVILTEVVSLGDALKKQARICDEPSVYSNSYEEPISRACEPQAAPPPNAPSVTPQARQSMEQGDDKLQPIPQNEQGWDAQTYYH